MTVEYSMNGEVEPAGLYQAIRGCHQRLAAVIDEIPNAVHCIDDDGEESPAEAVIEEVFAFLGTLAQELEDWSKDRFVRIEENLYGRLWAYCREQEKNFDDRGIEAKGLLRAVVNTVIDDAMAKPIDLERAVSHHRELFFRQSLERQAEQKSDPTAGESGRTAVAQRAGTQAADSDGQARDPGGPAWSGGRRPRQKVIAGNGRKQRRPARR
jgi:hypothetical protein